MTFKDIKAEVLKLSEPRRGLAEHLLPSLEPATGDVEHDEVWAEEAARRYRELRKYPETGIPAEELFSRLRSSVR